MSPRGRKKNKKLEESSGKSTFFNDDWLNKELHSDVSGWVGKVKGDDQNALCRLCNKKIFLSGMGKGALTSHAKSQNHGKKLKVANGQHSVSDHFNQPPHQNKNNTQEGNKLKLLVVVYIKFNYFKNQCEVRSRISELSSKVLLVLLFFRGHINDKLSVRRY